MAPRTDLKAGGDGGGGDLGQAAAVAGEAAVVGEEGKGGEAAVVGEGKGGVVVVVAAGKGAVADGAAAATGAKRGEVRAA